MSQNKAKAGFTWTVETIKDGIVIDREVIHNLFPIQGLNDMLNVWLKSGTQSVSWYVALYSGNYVPVPGDTAASFPAAATEITAYEETTRIPLVLGSVSAGGVDNVSDGDTRSIFTGTVDGTQALGGFITNAPAKGATTGVLASAVRFTSPKSLDDGTVLRVTCSFQIVSA